MGFSKLRQEVSREIRAGYVPLLHLFSKLCETHKRSTGRRRQSVAGVRPRIGYTTHTN